MVEINSLVVLQTLHGIIGALAVASCFHPVLTIRLERVPNPRIRLSGWLAAGLTTAVFAMGLWLYVDYREVVRPWLLVHAPGYHDYAFETKEALGYFALIAVWTGAITLQAGRRKSQARRAARALFAVAFTCGLVALALGVIVASIRGF